ncbi:methyl-accepting chemotaxis protein [Nitrosopumilus ureiphilus]|uniref:methyl-accepting chemotaxis protein n=1 Tax=Nitrosopumilus ureiphilus TaxID=1470067 RepID=UPI0015CB4DB1|nr:methyl-accepting chemotaxis protein [Nitrosopumilus ureiphilus]
MSQISKSEDGTEKKKDFFKQVVDHISSIGNEINDALKSTKVINRRTHMLSTTAKIEANRTGDVGRNFLIVSNSIEELGTKTDNAVDKMKKETLQEIEALSAVIENKSISIQGNRLANLALTNIRLIDRNLFERSADIRWWATDDILVKSLVENSVDGFQNAESRLGIILKSYTVYYDLILCDVEGNCKASGAGKFGLSGRNFSDKTWFRKAMDTVNGAEYGFQTVHHSPRINDDYTIVYSCKIHEDGDPEKKVIGVLGAVFKWRDLAQRIVNETPLSDEEKSKSRVLLCDESGNVLADTKEKILQNSINFHGKNELFQKEKGFSVVDKNEKTQLICHALSTGFEGYKSKDWHSLIIQDIDVGCHNQNLSNDNDESLDSVIEFISKLSEETQKAIEEINKINDETQVLSLNAAIEAARVGDAGRGFGVISGFMGDLSRMTAKITTDMDSNIQKKIKELNSLISSNSRQIKGDRLANLSFTNIDLIDRVLYERTADVRWWATENSIMKALSLKTQENKDFLSARLRTILQYYTVYEDLIVCDMNGNVLANGHSSDNIGETNMESTLWFQNALKTRNGEDYGFDIIQENKENGKSTSLVFSCKVHRNGDISRDAIGILGIVFKWEQFVRGIFNETPLNGTEIDSSSLFILDSNGSKLAENNKHGDSISQENVMPLLKEKKNFQTITVSDSKMLSGHAQSVGYEGFSTGWHALIIQSQK